MARLATSAARNRHAVNRSAAAGPGSTGAAAAGNVRGRAPSTQRLPVVRGAAVLMTWWTPRAFTRTVGRTLPPVPSLVVLETGPSFADDLRRAWDAGDAVLPLDGRLPGPARRALVESLRAGEPVEPGDALVVPTSGSTGTPKGVVLTHAALEASALASSAELDVDAATDRWLCCMPLSHMSGLGVVTRCWHTGTPLDLLPAFDAAAVDAAARDRGCTLTTLVPTAYARIDAGAWRRIVLGGAPVPGGTPSNVVTSYGLTETCGGCCYDGRPFDGVEIRLVDGEVHLRGPVLLRCYRDGTVPLDGDGWLATGDSG